MRKSITTRLLLITCMAMINIFVLKAQTFQNTYLPAGDDNYVAGVAVSSNYWVIGNSNSFTPALGTEHILFSKYAGATGVSVWDRKYYSGVSATISYTATDIQAGYSPLIPSLGGGPLPCNFTACPVFAPAVNAIGIPKSNNYFYVSGYYKDPAFGVRRPLMLKLATNGNILWAQTNIFAAGAIYDEIGISAESCPNGDMIMVSQVTNPATGLIFPAITRVDINGVLLWRYFYSAPTFQPLANFIPHQSCVYREFINGGPNDPIGITITGEQTMPGAIGSTHFVMRVRYDGMMLWKVDYPLMTPSGIIPNDQGWDIMFEAESVGLPGTVDNFVVTGLSNALGAGNTPGCLGFLSRVNVNTGAFVNAHRFGVPGTTLPPGPLTYGQSIYQSSAGNKKVVISGGVDDPNSGIFNDTYLLEMDITNGTIFNAHHYNLTTPNFPRTESVVSVGTGYPTTGYFISTNSLNTYGGATLTDAHVIKTDVLGRVNATTCHSDTLKPVFDTVKSNPNQYCTEQVCDFFIQHQMVMKKKTAPHVLCFSATKLTDDLEASLELGENEIGVYPNPVSGNSDIQLLFTADQSGEYAIRILDVNGRVVQIVNQHFEEGDQQFPMATSMLAEGMYFITVFDGIRTASTKFIKVK